MSTCAYGVKLSLWVSNGLACTLIHRQYKHTSAFVCQTLGHTSAQPGIFVLHHRHWGPQAQVQVSKVIHNVVIELVLVSDLQKFLGIFGKVFK